MSAETDKTGEGGLRVLIVDDNAANAQTTGWMVELFNHDYRLAFTAADAIAMVEDYHPHVALLDIGLPDMNGFDLCKKLQSLSGCQHCVFMAQTGWDDDSYRQRAADAGFTDYLLKPFSVERLEIVLRKARS